MLFSYPNVWNTCLLILRENGYQLYVIGNPDESLSSGQYSWNAERGCIKLRAANPIELLGLAAIHGYHQPTADVPYWWRIEGDNLIAQLEREWTAKVRADPDNWQNSDCP